jgi:DNA repair exonuclease SbcCD ATPase subunit
MLVRTFTLLVVLAVGGAAAWAFSPGLRTQMTAWWDSQTGWTEAARQDDPVGFSGYAQRKLKQDLAKMDATRRELTSEVGRLSKTAREQSAMAEQARRLAEQFRDVYQTAQADARFPVEVRGAAYTESQVRSQVSMLLAEAEGYEASLADLESVRTTAEAKIEELAVRINRTEAQLASLATKRELLRARQLTAAGEELLAQVDELMTGNRQTIAANPVATVRELLARTPAKQEGRATDRKVDEFLTAKPDAVETTIELFDTSVIEPASQQTPVQIDSKDKPRTGKQPKPARTKPIFQQS